VALKVIPMSSRARNTGVKAKVYVRVSISTFVRIDRARIVADTNGISRAFDFD
jgi:hypothetical protein